MVWRREKTRASHGPDYLPRVGSGRAGSGSLDLTRDASKPPDPTQPDLRGSEILSEPTRLDPRVFETLLPRPTAGRIMTRDKPRKKRRRREVFWAPNARGSISHRQHEFEGVRTRNPATVFFFFAPLDPKQRCS